MSENWFNCITLNAKRADSIEVDFTEQKIDDDFFWNNSVHEKKL